MSVKKTEDEIKTAAKKPAVKKTAAKTEKPAAVKPAAKPRAAKKVDAVEMYVKDQDAQIKKIEKEGDKPLFGKKAPKKIPAKKLPGVLKKIYKADKIEKKLYRKIYIASDLELVKKYITENPDPKKSGTLCIPKTTMIPKDEFQRLKLVGKEVAKNTGSFKLIPFIAVVAFIAAIVIAVITFKNPLTKRGIIMAMQKAFGARCDIVSVDVQILGSSITVNHLQQANKDSPMKNLFEFEKVRIDFNLTEALRGKFDAEAIEVLGVAIDTDRTYSGELPQIEKAVTVSKKDSDFDKLVQDKSKEALEVAKKSIEESFAEYNPQKIIEGVQENLSSPKVAQNVQKEVEGLVNKWQDKPSEMEKKVTDFSKSIENFVNKDWSKVQNPAEIAAAIAQVNDAIKQGTELSNDVKKIMNDIGEDSKKIKTASAEVQNAIKNDTALVKTQFDKITSFRMEDTTKILGNTLESVLYSYMGKYYPYARQAYSYAMRAKEMGSSKKEKKKIKPIVHERAPGVDVYWKADNVPKFLIEKISFDGLGVDVNGYEISSDMDKRGKPATGNVKVKAGVQTHKADVIVDARTVTDNPLATVKYTGDNYAFAFSTPYLVMNTGADIKADCSVTDKGEVTIKAKVFADKLKLTSESFEPEFASRFYNTALASITDMQLGVNIGFSQEKGMSLSLESDLDKQFVKALKAVVNSELEAMKKQAMQEIKTLLDQSTGGVTDKISEFVDLENGINLQSINMNKLNAKLNDSLKELKKQSEAQARSAAQDAAKDAINNSGAGDAVKGFGKMFGF